MITITSPRRRSTDSTRTRGSVHIFSEEEGMALRFIMAGAGLSMTANR